MADTTSIEVSWHLESTERLVKGVSAGPGHDLQIIGLMKMLVWTRDPGKLDLIISSEANEREINDCL